MSKPYLCYTHIWKVLLEIAVTLEENLSTYPGLNCTLVFMKTKIFLFLNFFSLMKRMSWQNQRADIENESNVKVTYDQHVSQL